MTVNGDDYDEDVKGGDDDELHLPKTKRRVVAKALHHRGEGAV